VQINNHALDAAGLATLTQLEVAYKTRLHFADAMGHAGLARGPVLANLVAAAQQRGGFSSYSENPNAGTRSSIWSEGVSFTNSSEKTTSWYAGLGSSVSECMLKVRKNGRLSQQYGLETEASSWATE